MAQETPEGHFEHPDLHDQRSYKRGVIIDGEEQQHDGIVNWLEQLEIRLTGIVQSTVDLPEADPDKTDHRTGNERIYAVRNDRTLRRDTGTEWEVIAGRGAADEPLPPSYHERITTRRLNHLHFTSEYSSFVAANDAATAGDVVVLDTDETVDETIFLNSGVSYLSDNSHTLTLANGVDGNLFVLPEPATNIRIRGLVLDQNGQNQTTGRGILGIVTGEVRNVRILDTTILNAHVDAIKLTADGGDITDVLIRGNVAESLSNGTGHGIVAGINGSGLVGERIRIDGNNISPGDSFGATVFATNGATARNCSLSGNHIIGGGGSWPGVGYEGDLVASVISNNTIQCTASGTTTNAISVTDSTPRYITVTGNVAIGTNDGINIGTSGSPDDPQYIVIANNSISTEDRGVQISNNSQTINVAHNQINAGQAGIHATSSPTDISVIGNWVTNVQNGYAVRITAPRSRIIGNRIANAQYAGLLVQGNGATVVGNVCLNNGHNGNDGNAESGIALSGVTDCAVIGNRCTDTQGTKTQTYGINSYNSADYNSFVGNTVRGNKTTNLSVAGANSATAANIQ